MELREKSNTKDQILDVALDLFSLRGFEATSISQIAEVVGVRKASIYSHFDSKQEILDSLINQISGQFQKHTVLRMDDNIKDLFSRMDVSAAAESILQLVKNQAKYVIHDPYVSKARKMLTIEQFQNPELAKLHGKQSYEMIYGFNVELIKKLIQAGILKDHDPEIMAAQFAFPISMWINLCDREPEREEEAMQLIEKHVKQFFEVNS